MSERDEYDDMAEKLLPCVSCDGAQYNGGHWYEYHHLGCPAHHRPVVAAALREQGQRNAEQAREIERLRAVCAWPLTVKQLICKLIEERAELSYRRQGGKWPFIDLTDKERVYWREMACADFGISYADYLAAKEGK